MDILKLRKKIAGYLIGENVALYLPSGHADLPFSQLSDEELGAIFRHFMHALGEETHQQSLKRNIPLDTMIMQFSIVGWVKKMLKANADEMTVAMANVDSGDGSTTGNWEVRVKRLPGDYEFGPEGIRGREEDGKLVEYTVSWKKASRSINHPGRIV